jgi:hypothetical protein
VKKYLAVVLGVFLVLSFAFTAFAEDKPEITLGGKILVRGWYLDNVTGVSGNNEVPASTGTHSFYSTNVNLMVDAKVSDSVRGFIELETAKDGSPNSGLWYWGDNGRGYDSKPNADILIRQAWIQYVGAGLIGVPVGLKIGHMPISLGEKQFLNNERFGDDAILLWVDPMKETHIAVGTVKLNEGDVLSHTDDLDGYVALATYQWDKDNMVGVNYVWAHSDGNCPSASQKITGDDDVVRTVAIPSPNVDELNFHNVGIHANGKLAGISYAVEGDFQFGSIDKLLVQEEVDGELIPRDVNPKGWAVYAKLGYMIDPVNIRASFAYGSGDDNPFDKDCKEFQTLQGNDYGMTARLVHYTQIYERTVRTASQFAELSTKVGGNTTNTGIANTTYYNLGIDVAPAKDFSLSLDGFLLYASETKGWEDAIEVYTGEKKSVDDSLGYEIDLKLNYKITKNLSYFVEAGWFEAGDFYKDTHDIFGGKDEGVGQVVHGLALTF